MESDILKKTFLFERENELGEIDQFLDPANKTKISVISGARGTGKSALLQSHSHIIRSDLHTIQIKLDRLRPQAVDSNQLANQLAQIITKEEKNQGFKWRKLLHENEVDFTVLNSGDNDFHTLIDTYPADIRPLEKAALTRKACIELLRLYSIHGASRILIVIDDIDHIDATLNILIQDILSNSNINKVKILATCENRVQTSKKLNFDNLPKKYQAIHISRLSADATNQYIQRLMLKYDFSILEESIDWICNRSAGIPTLINECFHYLRTTNHLTPSNTIEYDELLNERLAPLNGVEIDIISTLSIYGNSIQRCDAQDLFPRHQNVINNIIEKLIFVSLISDKDDTLYFTNDNIRKKCANIGGKFKISAVHERIACYLYHKKENRNPSIEWHEIADHLIATDGFFSGDLTPHCIIDTILIAVEKADEQNEFGLMYAYTKFAIRKFKNDFWEDRYNARIRLNLYCQRTAYLNNDLDLMEHCTSYLLTHADSLEEKTICIENAVDGYISKNRENDAISLAIEGIKELGHTLDRHPTQHKTALKVLKIRYKLSKKTKNDISQLTPCNSSQTKSIIRLLLKVAHSTYGNNRNLFAISCCEIIDITLSSGLAPESAYAVQIFCSSIVTGYFRKLSLGRKISRNWEPLYTEQKNYMYSARSRFIFDAFIGYHTTPLSENVKQLDRDFEKNIEVGAYEMAAYSAHVAGFHALDSHEPLEDVNLRINHYVSKLGNITQQNADRWLLIIKEFSLSLTDEYSTSDFQGPHFNINTDINESIYQNDKASVFIAYHYATVKAYLCGNYDKALFSARKAGKYKEHVGGTYGEYLHIFISAIIRAKLTFEGSYSHTKSIIYIQRSISLFNSICTQKSVNIDHKKSILEAIQSVLLRKNTSSLAKLMDAAISAQIKGHPMDALITYELAFDLSPESKNLSILEKSLSISKNWGAKLVEARIRKKIFAISNVYFKSYTSQPTAIENDVLIDCIQHINSSESNKEDLVKNILSKTNSLVNQTGIWLNSSTHNSSLTIEEGISENTPWSKNIRLPVSSNNSNYGFLIYQKECIDNSQNLKSTLKSIADTLGTKLDSMSTAEKLQKSEQSHEALFSNAIDGIALAKDNGSMLHANKMFIDMLGISHANLIKENIFSVLRTLPSEDPSTTNKKINLFQNGSLDSFKQQYTITPNEKYSFITLRRINQNGITQIYGYVIDVTDKAKKEIIDEKIVQQARYFSSAIHEIKNPLSSIIGINEVSPSKTEKQKLGLFEQQQKQIGKLNRRFNDLLSIGAILEGKFSIQNTHFYIHSVIEDAFSLHKSECKQQNIEIDIQCDAQLTIISDSERISQIIENLIHNAIKYAQASCISVSCSVLESSNKTKNTLQLKIKDNGIGMEDHQSNDLFLPFEQETTSQNSGHGLGMYIVRCLMAEMGGTTKLKSSKNEGSLFTLEIPISSYSIKNTLSSPRPYNQPFIPPTRIPGSIVLIDDDSSILYFLESVLSDVVENVITFSNASKALEFINSNAHSTIAVLTDYSMSPLNGIEVIKRLRVSGYDKKIILSSGYEQNTLSDEEYLLNVKHLPKPIDIKALFEYLEDGNNTTPLPPRPSNVTLIH